MASLYINQAAIDKFAEGPAMLALLGKIGEQVASDAAERAPKRSGAGAASIGYETGVDADGAYVRVSWDRDHFYMLFHEVGTSVQDARPFLRPALQTRRSL